MTTVRFVGLDVHAETIAVAVAEAGGEVRSVGVIPNRVDALRKLIKKLGPADQLRMCYEAGPTGYVVYRELTTVGVACEVVAPTLVPVKAGDRVKTDRRDAIKLARCYRAGELTPVWVPDGALEAVRDLVRAREVAKRDQLRARHRLTKFLLRHGQRPPAGVHLWTIRHHQWVNGLRFPYAAQELTRVDYLHEIQHAGERVARLEQAIGEVVATLPAETRQVIAGLQALRGIAQVSAVTLVVELGRFSRFAHPRQLMGYSGAVPSEVSTGGRQRRGAITKTGNAHVRRVVIEAAWAYRHPPQVGPTLRKRHVGVSPAICEIAWKAQHRLFNRYRRLRARNKGQQQTMVAIGRELLGFIWAIGVHVEQRPARASAA
jgi:transposase